MGLIETLYSPGVMLLVSLVLIPLLVIGATVALVILLKLVTSGRPDVEKIEYRKYLRYDAGNPPRPGDFRRKVSMQYLGYLILFLAVEPIVILMALILIAPREALARVIFLYIAILLIYAPLLYYGIRESRRLEAWILG